MPLREGFIDHIERQFRTLDGIYERTNDGAWTHADPRIKGVWQWLYHTLETIEFYLGDQMEFEWGKRFGVDWEDTSSGRVPGRDDMKIYQADVHRFALQTLNARNEEAYLAEDTVFMHTGNTYSDRLVYLLRHTQQHIGDINQILRLNYCETLEWH